MPYDDYCFDYATERYAAIADAGLPLPDALPR